MKKTLFTAVLAIIAVGGVYALQLQAKKTVKSLAPYHYTNAEGCQEVFDLPAKCGSGPQLCTVEGIQLFDGSCDAPGNTPIQRLP